LNSLKVCGRKENQDQSDASESSQITENPDAMNSFQKKVF
jgi:hypothetical protein